MKALVLHVGSATAVTASEGPAIRGEMNRGYSRLSITPVGDPSAMDGLTLLFRTGSLRLQMEVMQYTVNGG